MNIIDLPTGAKAKFMRSAKRGKLPCLIIVHGWKSWEPLKDGGTHDKIASVLSDRCHAVTIALRGHRPARGDQTKVSINDHLADLAALWYFLTKQPHIDIHHMFAVGNSYAAHLVAEMSTCLKGLVLNVPALYPDGNWDAPISSYSADELRSWRQVKHTPEDSSVLLALSQFKGDLLIMSNGADEQIPAEVPRSYHGAARSAKSVIHHITAGAPHVPIEPKHREEYMTVLSDWLRHHYPTPTH